MRPFHSLSQSHHLTASHSSPGDNHLRTRGWSERTQGQAKNGRLKLIQLHVLFLMIYLSAASTVIPLLPKATFTPSIQPKLGLPRTRPPLNSAINTLLAIRSHPFFPHAQTISILSDLLFSLTPFKFQLSYTPIHC